MKIAFINSNIIDISKHTSKGTEIFSYILIANLLRNPEGKKISMTAFASGNSKLPIKTISTTPYHLMSNEEVVKGNYAKFEQLLVSKALLMQDEFDLFHVNIGNGELILPFAPFIKKPILITCHGNFFSSDVREYFSLATIPENVFFVAISESQRTSMPNLNYIKTIHHGIEAKRKFTFDLIGGNSIMWAGRAVPEKGLDIVLQVIKATKKSGHLFMITKLEFLEWLQNKILNKLHSINRSISVNSEFNLSRLDLIPKYQKSKLFLSPIQWEEPFGFVMIESMACGTPVVAYARGSVPEVVEDGVTGFVINPSDDDIRGNFVIKKTGFKGLCEAVNRIYTMTDAQYQQMRRQCRERVEKKFNITRMVQDYIDVYKQIIK